LFCASLWRVVVVLFDDISEGRTWMNTWQKGSEGWMMECMN
jgi:hypothetical protein